MRLPPDIIVYILTRMCIVDRKKWIDLLVLNKEINVRLKPIFESYFETIGWYGYPWQEKGMSGVCLTYTVSDLNVLTLDLRT